MLQSTPPDYLTQRNEPIELRLTNPAQLKTILALPEEPQLREADVFGYAIAKWCDYPALIDGKQGDVVTGSAYLVRYEKETQKLLHYETNAYEFVDC